MPNPSRSVSLSRLFLIWLILGLQSFGGGVATLTLIRRAAVERERWISDEEFTRSWGLVQLAPGINLLALTILLGRRVGGIPGIAVALAGLLLPSAVITAGLTALYAQIEHLQLVERALGGIIPATVGIGLVTAIQIAQPILSGARQDGRTNLVLYSVLFAASIAAAVLFRGNVIVILLAAGAVGALIGAGRKKSAIEEPAP